MMDKKIPDFLNQLQSAEDSKKVKPDEDKLNEVMKQFLKLNLDPFSDISVIEKTADIGDSILLDLFSTQDLNSQDSIKILDTAFNEQNE